MNLKEDLIKEIEGKYDCTLERPWAKHPEYVTIKERDTDKWFAAFLLAPKRSLGIADHGEIPVLNLKAATDFIAIVAGSEGIYPGYHMNKRHWISVLLDGTVPKERILSLVDTSYHMVADTPTKRIYEAVRSIPRGKVATYGQVAAKAGNPRMSRAVGNALHRNPDESGIPCYRVVNAKGELSEAFVFGGINIQRERLESDGIILEGDRVDLKKYGVDWT